MKAFPGHHPLVGTMNTFADGMDLRDYFAAKAMHYWLCNPIDHIQIENLCKGAYMVADAMMKAREK